MIDSAAIAKAREALDNMDDYARMTVGVDAIGPRGVLEKLLDELEAALKAEPTDWKWVEPEGFAGSPLMCYGDVPPGRITNAQPLYATPLAQQRPLSLDAINEWTARRIRAAGGIEGVTNIPSIMEEAVRFAEAAHNIKEKP